MEERSELSFANIEHLKFIENLYVKYQEDPNSIEESWRHFFEGMEFSLSLSPSRNTPVNSKDISVFQLIDAYRRYGHFLALLNPIALEEIEEVEMLKLSNFNLSDSDMKTSFSTFGLINKEKATLEEIVKTLKDLYCSKIGYDFMFIRNRKIREWIYSRIEKKEFIKLSIEEKRQILNYLNKAESFETFIHTKFTGQKRFSLEGLETLIPVLASLLDIGGSLGIQECVLGMAHRGRLNVLANIFNKSYSIIFSEFEENYIPGEYEGSGDVKYHKGFSSDIVTHNGHKLHISIAPNTSHLESVNGIVEGQVRAKQVLKHDQHKLHILPILIHGDAALAGQGIIYEVTQFNRIDGYATGGSIHIVLDNQIGFTTLPMESRSMPYCTDIARAFDAPVFHANAEDPESCIQAVHMALEIRQKFQVDVFIHLIGYRKYGHNEADEPFYTQPLQYQKIAKKSSIRSIYSESLIHQGVLEKELAAQMEEEFKASLQKALEGSKELLTKKAEPKEVLGNRWDIWKGYKIQDDKQLFESIDTTVSLEKLCEILRAIAYIPENFDAHKKIRKLLSTRQAISEQDPSNLSIDWGLAEHLAFASILMDNKHIRLSGQDARRGTFSQRHAYLFDQSNANSYCPLEHLSDKQGLFHCYNSPLSEYGVLAFEYGYSISYRDVLVIWEAQYGDFANGAQIIIDGYLAAAEQKWNRLSGLVVFLPHGYEGAGPEHSSARIERFLQLSGENNMFIANPTTPAQLFHLLRRHTLFHFKKPLVVFTPKNILRHKRCVSSLKHLSENRFLSIIDDPIASVDSVEKVVLCSGKIYYDLLEEIERRNRRDMALIRIEQLYPFDTASFQAILKCYTKCRGVVWVQEEPENMGAWSHMQSTLQKECNLEISVVSRPRSASTATGSHYSFKKQLERIYSDLFGGEK